MATDGSSVVTSDVEVLERVRDEVMAQARDAHAEYHRCVNAFAAPYPPENAQQARDEAHGRWLGLWKAVNIIDALAVARRSGGAPGGDTGVQGG